MPNRVKTAIVPPGGWRYDPYGLEASGYPEIIEAILTYRLQNMIPVGNVEQDFEDWFCQKFPGYCHPVFGGVQQPIIIEVPVQNTRLVDDVQVWAMKLYRDPRAKNLVPEAEALRRASICIACPKNKEWKGGCQNCNDNAERLLAVLRSRGDVGVSNQLQGCTALRHCNRTAAWMPKELINQGDVPNNCWMK